MSLHIIIDGYNLIRHSDTLSMLDSQDLQMGREALVDTLAAYKKFKKHKITVVFDGTEAPCFLQRRDRVKGINIRFSQEGEQADTVIKRMAIREREKALIVTSDRAIADVAQLHSSAVISSPEFEQRLIMAAYMDTKGVDMEHENTGWVPTTKKKGPRKRLPRKKRRNRMKTRKL